MANGTCRVTDCTKPIHHRRNQLCKMHQSRMDRNGTTEHLRQPTRLKRCDIEGCNRKARSGSAEYCAMHYHRTYRHGSPDKVATETDATASHGRMYRTIYIPGHPAAGKRGMAYEHRVVLYDSIGQGPHRCHWCETEVRWDATRGNADALQVDHLNAVGDDNRPANLVPSCGPCNSTRANQARHRALTHAGFC
mgnify:CR=1 FL=1